MARGTKAVNEEYEEVVGQADQWEEHGGSDFAPAHDFSEPLVGTLLRTETKEIKGKDRVLHTFDVDGDEVVAWGTAILDNRLKGLEGKRCKVVKTGKKITTKSGNGAWEFQVFVSRAALAS
jgi:hypothetical protein